MRNPLPAVILLAFAGLPAAAEGPPPALLAAGCAACHGPAGHSPGTIPAIDTLDAAALAEKLNGFRAGTLEATVMTRIAKGFTEDEIAAMSDYIAGLH